MKAKQIYRIDLELVGGNQARLEVTDRDLLENILLELKATSTFHRQVVKTWQLSETARAKS